MITDDQSKKRSVLPRWLTINRATNTGEMNSIFGGKSNVSFSKFADESKKRISERFEIAKKNWYQAPVLINAEELVSTALAAGRNDDDVRQAAGVLLSSPNTLGVMREFTKKYILLSDNGVSENESHQSNNLEEEIKFSRNEIRNGKTLLRIYPRNALLLAEMALNYSKIGQYKKSKLLLDRALLLLPYNRYVLRAAVRLYCHINDPELALSIIQKSGRSNFDPWLRAAELATFALVDKPPKGWKKSKRMLNDFNRHSVSELAAQLGTFELEGGSRNSGIKVLKVSAECPTENSLAQIEYLSRTTKYFSSEELIQNPAESPEASANISYSKIDWQAAMSACERWFEIEQFSISPVRFASKLATISYDKNIIRRAIKIMTLTLYSNPTNTALINNISVLHAYDGDTKMATEIFGRIKRDYDITHEIIHTCTSGLILIRSGELVDGFSNYRKGISMAFKNKIFDLALKGYHFACRELYVLANPRTANIVLNLLDKKRNEVTDLGKEDSVYLNLIRDGFENYELTYGEKYNDFIAAQIKLFTELPEREQVIPVHVSES